MSIQKNGTARTQQTRSRKTRALLIGAAIDAISKGGLASLRAGDIARSAGVTWGAAQHLFGAKNALLCAVAYEASEQLCRMLESKIPGEAPLHEKLDQAVEATWSIYNSPAYFAMIEILRGLRNDPIAHKHLVGNFSIIDRRIDTLWKEIFAANNIDTIAILNVRNFVTLCLSSLAARKIYYQPSGEAEKHLHSIKSLAAIQLPDERLPRR